MNISKSKILQPKFSFSCQNYDAVGLFDLSNSFYVDMGFANMSMCYNTSCALENTPENMECHKHHPMIHKPDWDVVCHASAWDGTFDDSKEDFRFDDIHQIMPQAFLKSFYAMFICVLIIV